MCKLSITFATSKTSNLSLVDEVPICYDMGAGFKCWTAKIELTGEYTAETVSNVIDEFLLDTSKKIIDPEGLYVYGLENMRFIARQADKDLKASILENKCKSIRLSINREVGDKRIIILDVVPSDDAKSPTDILEAKLSLAYTRG